MDARRVWPLALCLALASVGTACDEVSIDVDGDVERVRGSGNVVTETREVSGFDQIVVLGSGTVDVSVTGTESLTIEAEDNIIPLLTTEVSGGRLELGSRESFSATKEIIYTITVIDLNGVEIDGSGDVSAVGLDNETFEVEINGSGDIAPDGTADALDVAVNGSGNYDGERLVAVDAVVRVSGSGSILVNATGTLDAEISGSGDIEYLGDPVVTESISGSGSISPR